MMLAPYDVAALIGLPWAPWAEGPEKFSCYGLVRHVLHKTSGLELPSAALFNVDNVDDARTVMAAARRAGWAPADPPLREGDVALMRNLSGTRHMGIACRLEAGGVIGVLNANGSNDARGHARGCVQWAPMADMAAEFYDLELWRPRDVPTLHDVLTT